MALLLQSLRAGSLVLNNRLVMPPMATEKADSDGKVSQALLDHYEEKSRGGYLSLIVIEHSYISTGGRWSQKQLSISEDSVVAPLKGLADAIHRNGSKTIMQINHSGSAVKPEVLSEAPVAPSPVRHPRREKIPRSLTREEISNIVDAFRNAALRVKNAGFDGVEIHSAHGHLLNQFLSPLTNMRTDEYGGDIYNRIRIHLQVISAVRQVVGNDFPVLLRLGVSDFMPGGITIEDSQVAAQEFEKAGINILDVTGGITGYAIPGLAGQGYFSSLSKAIKEVVSIPVILTGGITEVHAAEQILQEGKADLIGVGRAINNDSNWARKAVEMLS